jgi:hypothetical protein
MGLFNVVRRRRTRGVRPANPKDNAYLRAWADARRGVEAFVEPKTMVTETTVVLVAHDGEWTRRRITERDARELGKRLSIPVYDVALVGYPARMRAYTAELSRRQKLDENG